MNTTGKYVPALHFNWLTPLYDPLLRRVMHEAEFKRRLIAQANLRPGQRVLDLGAGTGTLTVLIKQTHPAAEVVGLDGDPQVLEMARAKAAQAGVEIAFDHGMAFQLPYPDESFDRVLTSLVLHHLTGENKQRAAREVFRVLRRGGEVHVVDFGKPVNLYSRLASEVMRRFEEVGENADGLLPGMFRMAGFDPVEEPAHFNTLFGTMAFLRGKKRG